MRPGVASGPTSAGRTAAHPGRSPPIGGAQLGCGGPTQVHRTTDHGDPGPLDGQEHCAIIASTMVLLELTDDPGAPLHDRIAAAVRRGLADASLAPGERLPAARDLADALGVHPNTVLRAYRLLRDEGLLELRRGRGATLRAGADLRGPVHAARDALLAAGARAGLSRAELARLVLGDAPSGDPDPNDLTPTITSPKDDR